MTTFSQTAEIVKANDGRYGLRAPKGGCVVDGKFYRGGSFCRPYRVDNPHELPTVEIKGASYLVRPIPAGEFGVSAVRLTKLSSHEAYDVIRRHDGLVECDCPSYTFTHEGKGTCCKHGVACMAHGLLPVAEVAPIATAVDRVVGRVLERVIEAGTLASDDESACPVTEDDHRAWKARQKARLAPSPLDQAEWLGMALMLEGEPMAEIPTADTSLALRFAVGQSRGLEARQGREAEERAHDAWVDQRYAERMADAFAETGADWHEAERIEAVGCVEARLV